MPTQLIPNPPHLFFQVGATQIYGLATGFVRVKRSHRGASLGIGQILLDPLWTEWMPIWTWVIVHPEGLFLVDTGEKAAVQDPQNLTGYGPAGWVSGRILRFNLGSEWELKSQLDRLGLSANPIRGVVLTHLHLDHVDGLDAFPQAAPIWVNATEWETPYGAVTSRLPAWLEPTLLSPPALLSPGWDEGYALTADSSLRILSTPGHTFGHQSVLVEGPDYSVLLAGDVAFSQQQLLDNQAAGICVDKALTRQTYAKLKALATRKPLLFLPSHDPENAARVQQLQFLIPA